MSEHIHLFESAGSLTAVALPFEVKEIISQWKSLRTVMTRQIPGDFTRDEWAYVIAFLDSDNLFGVMEEAFGTLRAHSSEKVRFLARPRGTVAVWLPNNVSLLGPLLLILLSLSGNNVEAKRGSRSKDLSVAFLKFAIENLQDGYLKTYLQSKVRVHSFGREDTRHQQMASGASVRIMFGSNETAAKVNALPHSAESIAFSFIDRRSEAWLEMDAVNEETLADLIKVFSIYGRAGCTSPSKAVLLGANMNEVLEFREKLLQVWPHVVKDKASMSVASQNIMSEQLLRAIGWDVKMAPLNGAVLAIGRCSPSIPLSLMTLPIVPCSWNEAVEQLPANIQTLGIAAKEPGEQKWLRLLARSGIKRIVPIAKMHHFGSVWDGYDFWPQLFEKVEVQL